MNIRESIKRVLKESTEAPSSVKRRLHAIDWQIEFAIKEVKVQYNVCGLSEEQYVETVIEKAITSMYWDFFSDMDENTVEWGESYKLMMDYASKKFTQHLNNTYKRMCR